MATLLGHAPRGIEMGRVVLPFDSCLECTAHPSAGKTGPELAALRPGTGG